MPRGVRTKMTRELAEEITRRVAMKVAENGGGFMAAARDLNYSWGQYQHAKNYLAGKDLHPKRRTDLSPAELQAQEEVDRAEPEPQDDVPAEPEVAAEAPTLSYDGDEAVRVYVVEGSVSAVAALLRRLYV